MKNLLRNKIKIISKLPFVRSYYEGVATIFMLHRVHPFEDNKLFSNENMKVSPEFLEMFITQLKSEGYEFINLDRLYDILQNKESTKKKIVLTLDDGYKDNYEIAYPIFKKHKIPFTIYLTTSFPEKKAILWWYILEDLIMEYDEIKLSKNRIFKCKTNKEKERVFLEIRSIIISLKQDNFLDELNDLFESNDIDWYSKINELSMNWKQIIDISNNDLCTIAGHTKNHYALNGLKMDKVLEEINQANQLIELKIGKKIKHFSYPFGSENEVNQREFDIVKNLKLKTSTTTRCGNIYYKHKHHLECLPRVMLTENFDIKAIRKPKIKRVVTN